MHVGDRLAVTEYEGASWQKQSRRPGTLKFRELIREYRNTAGELVLRSRMVLVDTEFAANEVDAGHG
ncbi:Uncharacterised protein [Mycolicibacterium gilvum]|uniref:Uncharacterized protein n=2 Tax=Mycobacteriaceae TaxID=1762 RepID=A0A378SMY5_9MYCO|nr:Uncharacterised protein [Mycolicibacterium gilvum]